MTPSTFNRRGPLPRLRNGFSCGARLSSPLLPRLRDALGTLMTRLGPRFRVTLFAKSELLDQGREFIQGGSVGDAAEFAYFMIPEVGSIVELLYLGELPPPEKTIG